MKAYTLGQLAWVRIVGCFWKSAFEKMIELGISDDHAFALTTHTAFREGNLILLWHDYGDLYGAALEQYIDHILEGYPAGWPHNNDRPAGPISR